MYTRLFAILSLTIILATSCNNPAAPTSQGGTSDTIPGTFAYDLHFLQQHDSVIVLKNGDAQVIVSPKYQGKVFTSTATGDSGTSFGWIHYKAFDGPVDPHMN